MDLIDSQLIYWPLEDLSGIRYLEVLYTLFQNLPARSNQRLDNRSTQVKGGEGHEQHHFYEKTTSSS